MWTLDWNIWVRTSKITTANYFTVFLKMAVKNSSTSEPRGSSVIHFIVLNETPRLNYNPFHSTAYYTGAGSCEQHEHQRAVCVTASPGRIQQQLNQSRDWIGHRCPVFSHSFNISSGCFNSDAVWCRSAFSWICISCLFNLIRHVLTLSLKASGQSGADHSAAEEMLPSSCLIALHTWGFYPH